jgi:hypothetical protein
MTDDGRPVPAQWRPAGIPREEHAATATFLAPSVDAGSSSTAF